MKLNLVTAERYRIEAEYERRESEIDRDLYAPWQAGEMLMAVERKRVAALRLKALNRFPKTGDRILEIGYGRLGWLADLISWGIREIDLYGIELDAKRARYARDVLPSAQLVVGDATALPWEDRYFQYVIASTVFSSVLDQGVRQLLADEMSRVLCAGGIAILYDIEVDNPRNQNVKRLRRADVAAMFPDFKCDFRSTTLAPPIARVVAQRSWPLAVLLSGLPFLRTHCLAILVKQT